MHHQQICRTSDQSSIGPWVKLTKLIDDASQGLNEDKIRFISANINDYNRLNRYTNLDNKSDPR